MTVTVVEVYELWDGPTVFTFEDGPTLRMARIIGSPLDDGPRTYSVDGQAGRVIREEDLTYREPTADKWCGEVF